MDYSELLIICGIEKKKKNTKAINCHLKMASEFRKIS
jgi:hypothetical protein